MELFVKCTRILEQRYNIERNSYIAGGELLSQLGKNLQTIQINSGKTTVNFIIHGQHALYTKIVAYHQIKHIKSNLLDVMKTCTTIKGSKNQLQAFFTYNNGQYRNHTLAVSIGNLQHDMAIFMRKGKGCDYRFVHFDPNMGVSSQITTAFTKQFGKNHERYGYHSSHGNIYGECTHLSWSEILKFLLKSEDPFTRSGLRQYCPINQTYVTTEENLKAIAERRRQDRMYEANRRMERSLNKIKNIQS